MAGKYCLTLTCIETVFGEVCGVKDDGMRMK